MNQPDAGDLDRTLDAPSGPPTEPRTAPAPTLAMPRTEGFAPRPSDPEDETVAAADVTVAAVDHGDYPLGSTVTADGGPPGSGPTVFFDPGKPTPSGGRGPADRPTVEGYDILGELGRGAWASSTRRGRPAWTGWSRSRWCWPAPTPTPTSSNGSTSKPRPLPT